MRLFYKEHICTINRFPSLLQKYDIATTFYQGVDENQEQSPQCDSDPVACGAFAAFLKLPWEQEVQYGFRANLELLEHCKPILHEEYLRKTVHFKSGADMCEGWAYYPTSETLQKFEYKNEKVPVIIMAHGLGSQKDMGLHAYAEQYARSGIAVLVFDYRGYGGSEGLPRHVINFERHLEDWHAAVHWVHGGGLGPAVDGERVALWGVSYSGGHSLVTAAKFSRDKNKMSIDKNSRLNDSSSSSRQCHTLSPLLDSSPLSPTASIIRAVVATAPYLGPGHVISRVLHQPGALVMLLRALAVAINDQIRSFFGLPRAYIKLAGAKGELAVLHMSDDEIRLVPKAPQNRQGGWRNVAAASFILRAVFYRPSTWLPYLDTPTLVIAGSEDTITPAAGIVDTLRKAGLMKGHGSEVDDVKERESVRGMGEGVRGIGNSDGLRRDNRRFGWVQMLTRKMNHLDLHRLGSQGVHHQPVIQFLHTHLGVLAKGCGGDEENLEALGRRREKTETVETQFG